MDRFRLPNISEEVLLDKKVEKVYLKLKTIILEVDKIEMVPELQHEIQASLDSIESSDKGKNALIKSIRASEQQIIKLVQKHLKLVPKNYYLVLGMSIGMAAFGIPLGVTFGIVLENMGFIGIGLPIGLGVGMAIGASLDKKAESEGRQLPFSI